MPDARPDHLRLVLISDTHGHDDFPVPPGDVLIHAGDGCKRGSLDEARAWGDFLRAQPHPHKIVIAGNHDRCFESALDEAAGHFHGLTFLHDSGSELDGLGVWGSPWQPWFLNWAFNLQRGPELAEKWALIPEATDVLITHGPPMGVLDQTVMGEAVGCADLMARLEVVRPRVHVFGHIHEGYGTAHIDHGAGPGTLCVNASTCTLAYRATNPAVVVDLPRDRSLPARVVQP